MRKKHPLITLNIGLLERNVNKVLADRPERAQLILAKIRALVALMNEAKALCQYATACYIAYYMEKYPDMDDESNKARATVFQPILIGKDGAKTYHQQLLRLMLDGDYKNANENNKEARMAYQLLKDCCPQAKEVGGLARKHNIDHCSRTLEMLSSTMDTEAASHLQGRLPFVRDKVIL